MKSLIFTLLSLIPFLTFAQNVGINENGTAPNPGAILDVNSSDKGILIPRLETTAVANPSNGMLVFQPSDQSFYFYKGMSWEKINSGATSGGSFETTVGNLIRSNGSNIDSEDLIIGRTTTPGFSNITDKFMWYDQSSGAFRGGKVDDSQVWAPINIGANSFAYGENVLADGPNSVALGKDLAVASSNTAFAIGYQDTINGNFGSGALGYQNQVGGTKGNIAVGANNIITSDASEGAVALGMNSGVSGDKGAVAVGYLSAVTGSEGSVAIGKNILNTHDGAVIVGRNNSWSDYPVDLAFAVGIGNTPYDPANPRTDGMVIRGNGYTGFGVNFPDDVFQIKTKAITPNEGLVVTGDTANQHIHFFLHNKNVGGKQWGLLSTGGNSPFGKGKFIIRDVNLGRETLTIDSVGNLGLRTTDPMDDLEINIRENNEFGGISVHGGLFTKEAHLTLDATANAGRPYVLASTGAGADVNADKFIIKDELAGEERMIINGLGNLGIGKNSSTYKLGLKTRAEVNDGVQLEGDPLTKHVQVRFENNATNAHHYNLFATGGNSFFGDGKFIIRDVTETADRLIIEPDGNIGIGKLYPEEKLHVKGAIIVDTAFTNTPGTIQFKNNEFRGYDGTEWVPFGSSNSGPASTISDADGDTRIEVEETTDEDKINFYADGIKGLVMGESNGRTYLDIPNSANNVVIGSDLIGINAQDNVFVGSGAGNDNNAINSCVYVGFRAGRNNLSNRNIAIGFDALTSGDGASSVVMGYEAAKNSDEQIVSMGYQAGLENITGEHNTFIGTNAGWKIETGNDNTIIGDFAGPNSPGSEDSRDNTLIGRDAGTTFDASACTFIGSETDCNSLGTFGSVALGYLTQVTATNQARIGNSFTTSIGGYAGWSNISDGRVKRNIRETVPGLSFINALRPVNYTVDINSIERITQPSSSVFDDPVYRQQKREQEAQVHSGFIAQEVEQAAADLQFEFSGIDRPKNEKDTYGLRYAEFVVPLVKAVQEQQVQIEVLKAEIELLKKNKK